MYFDTIITISTMGKVYLVPGVLGQTHGGSTILKITFQNLMTLSLYIFSSKNCGESSPPTKVWFSKHSQIKTPLDRTPSYPNTPQTILV